MRMTYGIVSYIPRTQVKGKLPPPNSSKEEAKWQLCIHETLCVNAVTKTRCPGRLHLGVFLLEARHSLKYFSFQNPLWRDAPWMAFPDKCWPQGLHSWAALTCHPAGTGPSPALYIRASERQVGEHSNAGLHFLLPPEHSWGDSGEEFEDENNGHKWFH